MYVVTCSMMGGKDAVAVFSNRENAEKFIQVSYILESGVEEHEVQGDYVYPEPVYAAHEYSNSKEIHEFTSLFSNFDDAMSHVNERGLAVKLLIRY